MNTRVIRILIKIVGIILVVTGAIVLMLGMATVTNANMNGNGGSMQAILIYVGIPLILLGIMIAIYSKYINLSMFEKEDDDE